MNRDEKLTRYFQLKGKSPHAYTPEDSDELRRLSQELFSPDPAVSRPDKPARNDQPVKQQPGHAMNGDAPSETPAAEPERFQRVTNADQWRRLLGYYAECMIREHRQKFIIENQAGRRFFFPKTLVEARAAVNAGELWLPKPDEKRPDPLANFILDARKSSDLQLCLGFPVWAVDADRFAPLIISPVRVEKQAGALCLKLGDFEVSYAFLSALGFDSEEVGQLLDECNQVQPAPGQPLIDAIEQFLSNQMAGLLGQQPLKSAAAPDRYPLQPKTLYEAPCLFWVNRSSTTGSLIKELQMMSRHYCWDTAPAALKELLAGLPEISYPEAPEEGDGEGIYVTETNPSQRQGIAAARSNRQVVITGPPGTGKSQLVLNFIAQAVIDHKTVLFASHNNKAVQVVMSRLQDEVGFDGAVRTGRREFREAAVDSMSRTLNKLVSSGTPTGAHELRQRYLAAEKNKQENDRLLDRVRLLTDQRNAQQQEQTDYARGLPGGLTERMGDFSGFAAQPEELDALNEQLARFYFKTSKLRDREEALERQIRQNLEENSGCLVLVESILDQEKRRGNYFGGGYLRLKPTTATADIQQHLESWARMLPVFQIREQITQQKQTSHELNQSWLELCDLLPFSLQEAIRRVYHQKTEPEWKLLASELENLIRRAKRLAEGRLSWWEKVRFWLRRVDPVNLDWEKLDQLITEAGCNLAGYPDQPGKDAQGLVERAFQLDHIVQGCVLRHQQDRSDLDFETLKKVLKAGMAGLPKPVRDDVYHLDVSPGSAETFELCLSDLRAQAEKLESDIKDLHQYIRAVLEENVDDRNFLGECLVALGEAAVDLKLPPTAGLSETLAYLERWRKLIGLWRASQAEKRMEEELSTLPKEEELLQKVQTLQQELNKIGREILHTEWYAQVKSLPNQVLQETGYYISAVQQQMPGGLERGVYSSLKTSEEKYFQKALQVFPVWATTNLSAKTNLPLTPGLFDYVVIDEASQCDIPSALPLLYRGKQIVVIGDPNQLIHVATLYEASDQEAARSYGIAPEAYLYNTHSLFDLAQSSAGTKPGTLLLNEHYRSDQRIIGFSNREFYGEKLILRTDLRRRGYPGRFLERGCGVFWINIPGQARHPGDGSAENTAELDAIREQLPALLDALDHYQMPNASLGLVTPYRLQERRLSALLNRPDLAERLANRQAAAGTAHKFQGDERDVIILSPVLAQGLSTGSLRWLNRTSNLLNVALTRARSTLLIYGDWNYCQGLPPSSIYRKLSDYVKQQNAVFQSLQETPLLRRQPFPIFGQIVSANGGVSNRTTLRQFILSLQKYIRWADRYFDDHVFDFLMDILEHPDLDIEEIRLLTGLDRLFPEDGERPKLKIEYARALQNEFRRRGIQFDLGWLAQKTPHDRFLYSEGIAVNMPPFGGAYGDHKMVSEYTRSNTTPAFFEDYWQKAEKLSDMNRK